MENKNKDKDILEHILRYCVQIEETMQVYDNDENEFANNHIFRNAVSMSMLQIGELVHSHLSSEYKQETISEIPWFEVVGMRNRFAHSYSKMNNSKIWGTAVTSIPILKSFCIRELELEQNNEAEDEEEEAER